MEKVAIIGAGFVGSTAAYTILLRGIASIVALVDVNKEKAEGQALDIEHGGSFLEGGEIIFGDSYDLCKDSDIIVITAGAHQAKGETRLDLVEKNAKIFSTIIPQVAKVAPHSVLLIISNPVDILTYLTIQLSGFPPERVIGSGTTLDTSRLRHYLGKKFCINPKSVHAYILGEHGDSEFPAYSSATIGGTLLTTMEGYTKEVGKECFEQTKKAAYEVINRKGATYYAIGAAIAELCEAILNDEHRVHPVSTLLTNYYDEGDVCLSIPCVLGKEGIVQQLPLQLNKHEQEQLHVSAQILRETLAPYKK